MTDGGSEEHDLVKPVDLATTYAGGVSSAELRTGGYEVNFIFNASENSKLVFKDIGEKPLADGFSLQWSVQDGVDPANEKLTFQTK